METKPNIELIQLSTVLNEMTTYILERIRTEGLESVLDYSTKNLYRNSFERISIKKEVLQFFKNKIDIGEMAVEVITAHDDTSEVHYHNDAYAVLTILGKWEGVEEPEGAIFYFGSNVDYYPAMSGITLQVLPGIIHGFRSPEGAKPLAFLSVQSKKINEDFHVVS